MKKKYDHQINYIFFFKEFSLYKKKTMFIQLSQYRYITHTHFRDVLLIVKVPLKQNINNKHEYAQYVPVFINYFLSTNSSLEIIQTICSKSMNRVQINWFNKFD